MRAAFVALSIGAAAALAASPANAQEVEIERFFQQLSQLPNVVVSELAEALREARGVGIELVRSRYEHVSGARMESASGLAYTRSIGTDSVSNRALVPIPLSGTTALGLALSYESLSFRHDGRRVFPAERVHSIRGQLGVVRQMSDTWRFVSGVEIGVLSDFGGDAAGEALGARDVQSGGVVLFDAKLNQVFTLSFGGAVSSTLGLPVPIPVLRGAVEHEGFTLDVTVPTSLRAAYEPRAALDFGVRASLSGNSFHLVAEDESLAYRGLSLASFLGAEVFHGMRLEASGGLIPYRQLRLNGPDGEEIANLDPEMAPVFRVEVAFKL